LEKEGGWEWSFTKQECRGIVLWKWWSMTQGPKEHWKDERQGKGNPSWGIRPADTPGCDIS
jgi:hypothetical protein